MVSLTYAEPMPNQEMVIGKLGASGYFTKIDLSKGYWQIPIKPEHRYLTAFQTELGLQQFRVMPFGLNKSGAVFCRMVKLCLHERLLAYLSPDTVTGDDGRHPNRCRGGCRPNWNMSQCLLRSDTVIYEAATQRPVDELLLTFDHANRHWSSWRPPASLRRRSSV